MQPAGQDPEACAVPDGHTTALFADECQSFLDNVIAGEPARPIKGDAAARHDHVTEDTQVVRSWRKLTCERGRRVRRAVMGI
jgi:hypothetical protein